MLSIDFRIVVVAQGDGEVYNRERVYRGLTLIIGILFISRKLSESDMALPISLDISLFCILAECVGSYLCT